MLSFRPRLAVGTLRASVRYVVLTIVVALALAPRDARAGDVEVARQIFADGVKLFQRGDYEGARQLFRKADAEHHAPPIVYNLGLAEERLAHPQAAVDAYEGYVAEAGDAGPFTSAAVVAIAQIKARSTRLRIETKPASARVLVDAFVLAEASPTTFLVASGHHLVVAQGDGWRGELEVEAKGTGDVLTIVIAPPPPVPEVVAPVLAIPPPPAAAEATAVPMAPVAPETEKPDGFVWGASFALTPYHLQGAPQPGRNNGRGATEVMAGLIVEAGVALTDRFEFLARGFVGLGPEGKPTTAFMGGPGISIRVGSRLWLGATFIGGDLATHAYDVYYGTDLVYGAMAEVSLVLLSSPLGQWTVGTQPGVLLTDDREHNTAYFIPLTFGFRAY